MTWKCSVCNFVWEGEQPPEICPKCASPGEKYAAMKDEHIALMVRSSKTNALHIELLSLLPRLMKIAEDGIEDNLDPRCVTLFQRLKSDAEFLKASSMAELEGHVGRGKWGK